MKNKIFRPKEDKNIRIANRLGGGFIHILEIEIANVENFNSRYTPNPEKRYRWRHGKK